GGKPLQPAPHHRGRLAAGSPGQLGLRMQRPDARVLQGFVDSPRIGSSESRSSIDDRSPGGSPRKTFLMTRRRIFPLRVLGRRGMTWTAAGLNAFPSDRSTLRDTAAGIAPASPPGLATAKLTTDWPLTGSVAPTPPPQATRHPSH